MLLILEAGEDRIKFKFLHPNVWFYINYYVNVLIKSHIKVCKQSRLLIIHALYIVDYH